MWISLALLFNAGLYYFQGPEIGMQFLGGYLLEKSLSVDNIFVFVMIFTYFATPGEYQHRVLYWGILTALVLRGAMILTGATLIARFEFLIGLFGLLLIFTAILPIQWSLLVIAIVLGVSVGASLLFPRRELEPALVEVAEPSPEDLLRVREELRHNAQEAEAGGS